MISFFMVLLVLAAIVLMMVVLVQSSKGGGLAGTFGGSDASMMFGVRRTADFLIKITTGLATFLLVFSLVTNVLINKGTGTSESIIQQNGRQTFPEQQVPNVPQNEQPDQNQPQQNQPQDQNQQPRDQQPPK